MTPIEAIDGVGKPLDLSHLTNKYFVDLLDWREGYTDSELPEDYWFDVDMSDDFWYTMVVDQIDEETTDREALDWFLIEWLDKAYCHDLLGARIRSIDEIREERIDIITE